MKSVILVVGALALAVPGCKKDEGSTGSVVDVPPQVEGQADPAAAKPTEPTPAPQQGSGAGKVLETMNSGGYTYVLVDVAGTKIWAAGPEVAVKVGDDVSFSEGMTMTNYHSKTLDRTFELVYFVPALSIGGAVAQPTGGTPAKAKDPAPAAAVAAGAVAKADKTIAEIFAEKGALAGKPVTVRGKVVKFNAGIMGANWIHIQDGTGGAGTNDLTVTTQATVAVDDTVLVSGAVTVNKDFGSGYSFEVIIENATVTKQ